MKIPMLLRGPLLLCLLLSLTACGGKTIATRTERVNVPVPQPVPLALTEPVEEPVLPANATNDDLAQLLLDLQMWGRGAYKKLAEIRATHPPAD